MIAWLSFGEPARERERERKKGREVKQLAISNPIVNDHHSFGTIQNGSNFTV